MTYTEVYVRRLLRGALVALVVSLTTFGCALSRANVEGFALFLGGYATMQYVNGISYKNSGYYKFVYDTDVETVRSIFMQAIADGNREALISQYPSDALSESNARGTRTGSPLKLITPKALFEIDTRASYVVTDTVFYVVRHEGGKRVAFFATQHESGRGVLIAIVPYRPNKGAIIFQKDDQMQEQAIEELHQNFWLLAVKSMNIEDITPRN